MDCIICGGKAEIVKQRKQARYRGEMVEVSREVYRCHSCDEEFVTPDQARNHVRSVKNEIRKKSGLLSPERIAEIRSKLQLTQAELEDILNTGRKVVVRWESGKVIQGPGHDNMLRLLERQPGVLQALRQIKDIRSKEQDEYASSRAGSSEPKLSRAV